MSILFSFLRNLDDNLSNAPCICEVGNGKIIFIKYFISLQSEFHNHSNAVNLRLVFLNHFNENILTIHNNHITESQNNICSNEFGLRETSWGA